MVCYVNIQCGVVLLESSTNCWKLDRDSSKSSETLSSKAGSHALALQTLELLHGVHELLARWISTRWGLTQPSCDPPLAGGSSVGPRSQMCCCWGDSCPSELELPAENPSQRTEGGITFFILWTARARGIRGPPCWAMRPEEPATEVDTSARVVVTMAQAAPRKGLVGPPE